MSPLNVSRFRRIIGKFFVGVLLCFSVLLLADYVIWMPHRVNRMIRDLKDPNPEVRRYAAQALGWSKSSRAIEPLILTLQDDDDEVLRYAAQSLGKIGAPAVDPLIQALKSENARERWGAADALGQIGTPRVVEPLVATLKDPDHYVRESAAWALHRSRIRTFSSA